MDNSRNHPAGILLQVYADIDLLALELCSDRLPYAPSVEARRALMDQINEEVVHFSLQEETLMALDRPFSPVISLENRLMIKEWFARLDWYEFLAGLQLGIEGIGISVVETVSRVTHPVIQESLRIPIADERRQASFGVREWRSRLSGCTPHEKEVLRDRVLVLFEEIYAMTDDLLPVPFEACWSALGLKKADLWDAVCVRTCKVLDQCGFDPKLPASFVA